MNCALFLVDERVLADEGTDIDADDQVGGSVGTEVSGDDKNRKVNDVGACVF